MGLLQNPSVAQPKDTALSDGVFGGARFRRVLQEPLMTVQTALLGASRSRTLEAAEQFEKANGVADRVNLAHLVAIHRADFRRSDAATMLRGKREHFCLEIEIAAFRREKFRGEGAMEHPEAAL